MPLFSEGFSFTKVKPFTLAKHQRGIAHGVPPRWKHEIGYGDLLALRSRLEAVMERRAQQPCRYQSAACISTTWLTSPAGKIDGVGRREKFRVRYYNGDTSFILLRKV
jgi:hypothetical protein